MWSSLGARWVSSSTIPCSPVAVAAGVDVAAAAAVVVAAAAAVVVDVAAGVVADAVVAMDTGIKAPTGAIPRINF